MSNLGLLLYKYTPRKSENCEYKITEKSAEKK